MLSYTQIKDFKYNALRAEKKLKIIERKIRIINRTLKLKQKSK